MSGPTLYQRAANAPAARAKLIERERERAAQERERHERVVAGVRNLLALLVGFGTTLAVGLAGWLS